MRNGSTIAEMLVVLCVVMLGLVMVSPAGGPSATTCTAAAAAPSEPAAKQPRPAGDALAAALAKQIAVDAMTVYRWEVGLRSPSLEMIDRLAEALGISPRKLLRAEP